MHSRLARDLEIHITKLCQWNRQLRDNTVEVFGKLTLES